MMDREYYFQANLSVGSFSFVSFSDLAPFLDELSKRNFSVSATVVDFEPPAAGFSEIAITVAVAAPTAYLSTFLATWAAEDAKALRRKLLNVMKRSRESPSGRRYVPLRVEIGRVRFYFHEQINDQELVTRLRAAQDLVAALPERAFEGQSGPGEYGFFWDRNEEKWKGGIYQYSNEYCLPERMLTDDPGNVNCYESPTVQSR
jgi:hypothetical protein